MKETGKEARLNAFLGKAFLLFAAAMVMLCSNPLTAYAEAYSGDGWLLDADGNLTIDSDDGMWDWSTEVGSTNKKELVKTVTVSEGVPGIYAVTDADANRPFANCPFLTTVSLPSTLTTIEKKSFWGCQNLTTVTMLGETPPEIGADVFSGTALSSDKDSPNKIYVPEDSIAAYKASWPQWADYIYDGSGEGDKEDPEKPDPNPDEPENPDDPQEPGKNLDIDPTAEDSADTTIDVQGFTRDATVYSVDVEWGAMTFQYENATWDATAHKTVPGAGWKVYDSANNKALDTRTDAINRIQVTNHSNADVWATLTYTGAAGYTDTSGSFEKEAADTDTDYNVTGEYLSLATANNGSDGAAGTPTVGTVYFMPSGIKEEYKKADGITKWSQLGTITVGILTKEP